MTGNLSVPRNAGIPAAEIKKSPVLFCSAQGVYLDHPQRKELSVRERADLFDWQTGALCDNVRRYAVCEKASRHFFFAFFNAYFNAALLHFFFHFHKKRPWHVSPLPSQLLVIFPMPCPQFVVAQIEDARNEEQKVAFFIPKIGRAHV
jgi:hypothetical protein